MPKHTKRHAKSVIAYLVVCVILLCAMLSSCQSLPATSEGASPVEATPQKVKAMPMRGVYIASVSNLNFPSRPRLTVEEGTAELSVLVENCASIGFDTIVFQVRPGADALYPSSVFPSSRFFTGEEGAPLAFDPLDVLCRLCAQKDLRVIAWVNPYRITTRAFDTKEDALASLSVQNPARLHPEWTMFYGGRLFFDPALSEVRELVTDGVREICENYPVAGVLFDDYFYPYPVQGEALQDTALRLSPGDPDAFRRQSVNALISQTHQTVKSVSDDLSFGVAPFGIWQNKSSDMRGSDTRGLEAYSSLYCDALAWIEEESIDYLAPQLYWERGFAAADFTTLARWWTDQVNGTGVGLVISYAAYKAGDFALGGEEIVAQMRSVRQTLGEIGSIQYGYADLCQNSASVRDAITAFYHENQEEGGGVV